MFTDLFPQRVVRAKAPGKPSCAQKASAPAQVVPSTVQAEAPADPLPPVSQAPADISMKEEVELCQAFSEALLTIQDVDEDDEDQPQLCSQYVKDIYSYLHDLEVKVPAAVESVAVRMSPSRGGCCCRCSRLSDQTTCRAMKSLIACEPSSSTGWCRFTPGSSCCKRLCTSRLPS